jgi:general stress protein 26
MAKLSQRDAIQKLRELIKDINIAMLTTEDADGALRSRPMGTQQAEFDGDLWFMTSVETTKVEEIALNRQVNVSYARPDKNRYVSVSGVAELVDDRAKIEAFWSAIYNAFFPNGKDDPALRLIKVVVEKAEYWDGPTGLVPTLIGFAKALAGNAEDMGDNERVRLRAQPTPSVGD